MSGAVALYLIVGTVLATILIVGVRRCIGTPSLAEAFGLLLGGIVITLFWLPVLVASLLTGEESRP